MDRVKAGMLQGVMLSAGLTAVLSVPVWLLAEDLPGWFALSEQAAEYCTSYLKAAALVVMILSLYVPLFGVFQGTRHVLVPALVALFALALRVAVTYLFKDSSFLGHTIIWWNGLFGFSLGCIISWIYFFSGRWRLNAGG